MIEQFEYKRKWWLPDMPERKIFGTLKFIPGEAAVLNLEGSFKDLKDINKTLEPDIILGSNGEPITLYKSLETNQSFISQGLLKSSFNVNVIFIGAHLKKPEDIKFKSLSTHYSHLNEWVSISGFDLRNFFGIKEVLLKYTKPESIKATINSDYKLFIDFILHKLDFVKNEASIQEKTYIRVESSEEKSFGEYLNIMNKIRNFLSLGINGPVYPLVIKGISEVNKEIINDKAKYPPIKIYYRLSDIPLAYKALTPSDMLFTYKDIPDKFEEILKNWFRKSELLEPVYNLYFATLYNPRMYLEHQFLSMVQAIESYHRRVMKNFELPEEEHNKRIEEIINAVQQKHKNWLKRKLEYSNQPILRKRLTEIYDAHSDISSNLIGDPDTFIHKVVVTRHYLTHYDESLKEQAAKGEELYHIILKLKILLEICLLTEIGFGLDDIKELLSRNRQYKYILNV